MSVKILRNHTEFAKIIPEEAQTFYSIIALTVQQEVVQQIDFTPLTRIRQGNDDNPQELYEKMMMTAKENCGLSQNPIDGVPPGYMQNLFVSSLQDKSATDSWIGRKTNDW